MSKLVFMDAKNFLGIQEVQVSFGPGVTRINGKNKQGKTSLLKGIIAAIGGKRFHPKKPIRHGEQEAHVFLDLQDLTVRQIWRADGTEALELLSPTGSKIRQTPQAVLNKLKNDLSFDALAFINRMSSEQRITILAKLGNIDVEKYKADRKAIYDDRADKNKLAVNSKGAATVAEAKAKDALVKTGLLNLPEEIPTIADLTDELRRLSAKNEERTTAMQNATKAAGAAEAAEKARDLARSEVDRIGKMLKAAEADYAAKNVKYAEAHRYAQSMEEGMAEYPIVDTKPIEEAIQKADLIREADRLRKAHAEAVANAEAQEAEAKRLTAAINDLDKAHKDAIRAAKLPIDGLWFDEELVYIGETPLDDCSGREKLEATLAIGAALNPDLKLMISEMGPMLDSEGLMILEQWADREGVQVILERNTPDLDGPVGIRMVEGHAEVGPARSDVDDEIPQPE